jgi:hypothetical protein
MATLFDVGKPRPSANAEAIRAKALEKLAQQVIPWLGSDYRADEHDQLIKDLDEATLFGDCGYRAARSLEDDGWEPNLELVEILDGFSHHLYAAHRDAVRAWVKEYDIKPIKAIGDVVKAKHGREIVEGPIYDIKHEDAQYYVRAWPTDPTRGAIINYEDVIEPPTLEPAE